MSQIDSSKAIPGFSGQKRQPQAPFRDRSQFSLANQKGRSGKFMAHLLGLDHEQALRANAQSLSGAGGGAAPLAGIKFSELFHGIKVTPNFLFFLMFLGFFLWIFVVYWVRHHEPLANQVVGTPRANTGKTQADRRLVDAVKGAFPVRTSANTGDIYVPNTPAAASSPLAPGNGLTAAQPAGVQPGFGAPASAPPLYLSPQPQAAAPSAVLGQGLTLPQGRLPSAGNQQFQQVNYFVQQTNEGARVRTIVSR